MLNQYDYLLNKTKHYHHGDKQLRVNNAYSRLNQYDYLLNKTKNYHHDNKQLRVNYAYSRLYCLSKLTHDI